MPGLMSTREEFADAQPLKGARITGSLHMTIQTAVLIETLTALGAEVRWCSCNIFSTQDHAAAAVVVGPHGTPEEPRASPSSPGRARRSRSTGGAPSRCSTGRDGEGPNMILDDGGDATMLVHKGTEFEAAGAVPDPATAESEEFQIFLAPLQRSLAEDAQKWTEDRRRHQGRHRGDHDGRAPPLRDRPRRQAAVPGDQRQRLRHEVEVRQPLRLPPLARRRHQPRVGRHARRQDRRRLRLRRRRQGLRRVAARPGRRVIVTEIDPICALQASMQGYQVRTLEDVIETADVFITTTGNKDIITVDDMARMKHQAIVGNIGHFDNEIDIAGLEKLRRHRADQHQAAGRRVASSPTATRSSCSPRAAC